jgi:hypothetical protein
MPGRVQTSPQACRVICCCILGQRSAAFDRFFWRSARFGVDLRQTRKSFRVIRDRRLDPWSGLTPLGEAKRGGYVLTRPGAVEYAGDPSPNTGTPMATVAGGRHTLGDPSERGFSPVGHLWRCWRIAQPWPARWSSLTRQSPTPPRPPLRRPVGAGVFSSGTPMAVLADRPTVAG